jgi:uncharacterized protein
MALIVYADASALVALFSDDVFTSRVEVFLTTQSPTLIVSDFAAAEFASAVARIVRMGKTTPQEAQRSFSNFDAWTARATKREPTTASDIASAAAFLRRLELSLRTPDAINIAIAQRVAGSLLTFDDNMARSARALGTTVIDA